MNAETVTGYVGQILDECEVDGKAIELLMELYNEALEEINFKGGRAYENN